VICARIAARRPPVSRGAPTDENIFALGDCARIEGAPLPATAAVAMQQAIWLGKAMRAVDGSVASAAPFAFKNLGIMVYIGGWQAVLDSEKIRGANWMAWVVWRSLYWMRLGVSGCGRCVCVCVRSLTLS
jgi:NADH dehydrogenase FAD-containing subunit